MCQVEIFAPEPKVKQLKAKVEIFDYKLGDRLAEERNYEALEMYVLELLLSS